MPKLRSEAQPSGGGIPVGRGDDEFIYAGYFFRRAGRLCWYIQSHSHPGSQYFLDEETGECSCWPSLRNPTVPCGHLRLLKHLRSKLKNTHDI